MKLVICGSSVFRKQKVELKKELSTIGIVPIIDWLTEKLATGKEKKIMLEIEKEHSKIKREYDLILWYYKAIKKSDGIIVLNLDKKGVKNYVGANTFLEIGYAHVLNKKIFLLNDLPDQSYIKDEIEAMNPIILNDDLTKIK